MPRPSQPLLIDQPNNISSKVQITKLPFTLQWGLAKLKKRENCSGPNQLNIKP
jgi:hypothetical protein